jgi:hypothetical protein
MRFMRSAPVCVIGDHMMGSSSNRIAQAVMILGRRKFDPSDVAVTGLSRDLHYS